MYFDWNHFLAPLKADNAAFNDSNSLLLTAASNQYVDFGNILRPTPTTPWSVEIWYFPTALSGVQTLWSNAANPSVTGMLLYMNGNQTSFQWYNAGGGEFAINSGTTSLSVGQWYQIVLTYDGSNDAGGLALYINGTSVSLNIVHNTALSAITYLAPLFLGTDAFAESTGGYVNRFSRWSAQLSGGQVTALYNNGKPAEIKNSAGLVNYYLPGNGSDTSTTVYDLQGTANGTLHNSPAYKAFAPFAFTFQSTVVLGNSTTGYGNYPNFSIPFKGNLGYFTYYQSGELISVDAPYQPPDLEIYDFSNPLAPTSVGVLPQTYTNYGTMNAIMPMVIDGNYGYIDYLKSGNGKILNVVDISNPASPSVVATVNCGSNPAKGAGMYKYGNFLYQPIIGVASGQMFVTDISNPLSPVMTSMTIPTSSNQAWITFVDHYMYLSTDTALTIYDMNTIDVHGVPTAVGTPLTPTAGMGSVTREGDYLYILGYFNNKLEVVDISNRLAPTSRKVLSITQPYQAAVANNILFVGQYADKSVTAYSIYDPPNLFQAAPAVVTPTFATTGTNPYFFGITIRNGIVYVVGLVDAVAPANGAYGLLEIYKL